MCAGEGKGEDGLLPVPAWPRLGKGQDTAGVSEWDPRSKEENL